MKWITLSALAACMAAGGCQTYQSQPLDVDDLLRQWQARSNQWTTLAESGDDQREIDAADGVTLAEATRIALVCNPTLRQARLEAGVARAGADEAGRWDDPRLAIDLERIVHAASSPWVVGAMLEFTIPLSGRLGLEKQLAQAHSRVALLEALASERQVVLDLGRAWLQWSAAVERVELLDAVITDLDRIAGTVRSLRDAGELDSPEARLFAIDLLRRRAELAEAQRQRRRLESQVRQWMGLTPEATLTLRPTLQVDEVPATEVSPEGFAPIAVARARYDAAQSDLELEIRRQFPDLDLGGGWGRDEGESRVLGGLGVPLPIFNANRRAIAEARARREVARARFDAAIQQWTWSRARLADEAADLERTRELVHAQLEPLVREQLDDVRTLLEAGEFSPLVLRDAIDAIALTRGQLLDLRLEQALIAVERLHLTESLSLVEGQEPLP